MLALCDGHEGGLIEGNLGARSDVVPVASEIETLAPLEDLEVVAVVWQCACAAQHRGRYLLIAHCQRLKIRRASQRYNKGITGRLSALRRCWKLPWRNRIVAVYRFGHIGLRTRFER
jgi:hypothetical protein